MHPHIARVSGCSTNLLLLSSVAMLGLVGCRAVLPAQADFAMFLSQPPNVGDAKIAALVYHDSGAYERDVALVASKASRWVAKRASAVNRPALVLDVDETALSN